MESAALIISIIGLVIAIWALFFTYKAYYYAKNANEETNRILKRMTNEVVNSKNQNADELKVRIKSEIIENAISEWRLRGTSEQYLRGKFEELKNNGWTAAEFEEIHKLVWQRYKNREPKKPMFE